MEPLSAQSQKKIAEDHLDQHKSLVPRYRKLLLPLIVIAVAATVFWQLVEHLGWGRGMIAFGILLVGYSLGRSLIYLVVRWASN